VNSSTAERAAARPRASKPMLRRGELSQMRQRTEVATAALAAKVFESQAEGDDDD